jgi:collagen triple helix repeat protein
MRMFKAIGVCVGACVAMLLLAVVAVAPKAEARIIWACVKRAGGSVHIVTVGTKCKRQEVKLIWNASGTKGAQGLQGVQGKLGPQGPVGPAGVRGVAGAAGATGATGAAGTTGATGAAGTTGATGATGSSGPAQVLSITGTPTTGHIVQGTGTVGTAVTLSGAAVFLSAGSFTCYGSDLTTPAAVITFTYNSGDVAAFNTAANLGGGATGDSVRFVCTGT